MVAHSTLTDPELHEPKGISSATSGSVYIANGAGSGNWRELYKACSAAFSPSTASPYVLSATSTDAILNPTTTVLTNTGGFTRLTSPNFRIRYDGLQTFIADITVETSTSSGTGSRDMQLVLFKNGTVLPYSRVYNNMPNNANWFSTSLTYQVSLSTNDYIEVAHASSVTGNISYAKFNVTISGVTT